MRICFFGTRMDLISGHSRPAFELALALIDRGHEVRIVSTSLSTERMTRHQAAITRSPQLSRVPVERPFVDLREMVRGSRRSRRTLEALLTECDLLHGFSFNAMSILTLLSPVRLPLILSLSTDIRPPVSDYLRVLSQAPFYLRQTRFTAGLLTPAFLLKRGLVRFHRIICWSAFTQARARSIGAPEGRVVKIPLGLDGARFDFRGRHSVEGSPVFMYAGLLSTLRGVPTLIRAFKRVVQRLPQARLIIADRGPHAAGDARVQAWEDGQLSRMIAEFGLEDSILVKRFEENLSSWFNASDAVVLPFSTTIGYAHPPLTLLEAMAHAKPVISTRLGSASEYVEDGVTGMLTDPGDEAGLADAMIQLDREAARQMGSNARRRMDLLSDWSDIAALTEAVYADAIRSADPQNLRA